MATLTITTTAAQDARLVVAFGAHLGLGRNATAAEIKADIVQYLVRVVKANEEKAAVAAAVAAISLPAPIDPT